MIADRLRHFGRDGSAKAVRLLFICMFAALGVINPFFPIYLKGIGLSGREMSLFFAVGPVLQVILPLFWGWQADRSGRPIRVLQVVSLGAFIFMCPVAILTRAWALFGFYVLHLVFFVALPGMADAVAVNASRAGDDYGRIRALGSVTFAVTSAAAGAVLSYRGQAGADQLIPSLQVLLLGATFLSSLGFGKESEVPPAGSGDGRTLLRDTRLQLLLVVAFLHAVCSAPYRGFLSILLRDRGISLAVVGEVYTIGVVAETAAFWLFERFRRRWTLSSLLGVAFAAASLRAMLTAWVDSALVISLLQLLHAFTFGVYWVAALRWLRNCVKPALQTTAQMLLDVALGAGTAIGALGTGLLYDAFASAAPAFAIGGLVELVPLVLILTVGKRLEPRDSTPVSNQPQIISSPSIAPAEARSGRDRSRRPPLRRGQG
jgi:PPP family 3-phenylpropionic acid transporter